jgi:hypothetical protein
MPMAVLIYLSGGIFVVVIFGHALSFPFIILALPLLVELFAALLLFEEPFAVALFTLTVVGVFLRDGSGCL